MNEIIISLIASIIWLFLGLFTSKFKQYISLTKPSRRLWKLKQPDSFIMCIANSTITDTGKYNRPATGIGQVKAVATLTVSIKNTYKQTDKQKYRNYIYMSSDQLHEKIEDDIILIGGTKNNIISKKYLLAMKDIQPLQMDTNKFIWSNDNNIEIFSGKTVNKKVVEDYGVIMRTYNPFSDEKATTAVLIAGSHTYGTIAASRYFIENLIKNIDIVKKDNLVILIKCLVINDQVTSIQLLKEYTWNNNENN